MSVVAVRIRSLPCGPDGIYRPGQRYLIPEQVAYALVCAKLADLDQDTDALGMAPVYEAAQMHAPSQAVAHQTMREKVNGFFKRVFSHANN